MRRRGVGSAGVAPPASHKISKTAELAHVPGDRLAKSVILEDDDGFVMAVLPSTCHIRLGRLSRELNRRLRLAMENELPKLFGDCELGAIPPVGPAYRGSTVMHYGISAR